LLDEPVDVGHLGRQQAIRAFPDLMRGSVIDAQRERSAAQIDAHGLPGEGLLENPLPQIAGEEEPVRPAPRQSRDQACLGNTQVLAFVDHHVVERPSLVPAEDLGEATQRPRPGDEVTRPQLFADTCEDAPDRLALALVQPGLPPEPRNGTVSLPTRDLPRVHDLAPLGQQEA